MGRNKKVVNATSVSEDGIAFKSKMERRMYELLRDSGLEFSYESEKFTVVEGFYPVSWYKDTEIQRKKQISISYRPDFVVKGRRTLYVIEVKGFEVEKYLMRRKLFLKFINDSGLSVLFFEVHTARGMKFCIDKIKRLEDEHST